MSRGVKPGVLEAFFTRQESGGVYPKHCARTPDFQDSRQSTHVSHENIIIYHSVLNGCSLKMIFFPSPIYSCHSKTLNNFQHTVGPQEIDLLKSSSLPQLVDSVAGSGARVALACLCVCGSCSVLGSSLWSGGCMPPVQLPGEEMSTARTGA